MKSFFRKIRKIVQYIPILWRDTDYDWAAILTLLAYKLQRTREHIVEHDIVMDAVEIHDQIKVCEDALYRLVAEDYISDKWDAHWVKWPHEDRVDLEIVSEGDVWTYRKTNPMCPEERNEFLALQAEEEKLRAEDAELFATTFAKHYRGWWC